MYQMHAVFVEAIRGFRSSPSRVTSGCEPPDVRLASNYNLLEKQHTLLTAEPLSQLAVLVFYRYLGITESLTLFGI